MTDQHCFKILRMNRVHVSYIIIYTGCNHFANDIVRSPGKTSVSGVADLLTWEAPKYQE